MIRRNALLIAVFMATSLGCRLSAQTWEAQVEYKDVNDRTHKLNLSMWYADEVKALRGAIVHSHGMMPITGSRAKSGFQTIGEWQKMAREQGMALIGLRWTGGNPNGDVSDHNEDPKWTTQAARDGIDALAVQSGRTELKTAPLAFIGFSAGGGFALRAAKLMEDRCFAVVHLKGSSIDFVANAALTSKVAAFVCYGELDTSRIPNIRDAFRNHRASYGEPWLMLPDRGQGHGEDGDGMSYGMLFIDSMANRLVHGGGSTPGTAPTLLALSASGSLFGSNGDGGTWQAMFQETMPTLSPADSFGTDPGLSWIPGEDLTMPWQSIAASNRWGKMAVYVDTATVGTAKTVEMIKGDDAASEIDWYIGSKKVADGKGDMTTFKFTPTSAGVYPVHVRATIAGVVRSSGLTVIIVEGKAGSKPGWMSRRAAVKLRN